MAIKYIDLNPSELMHWKYIKREKLPNGKYRYYYDAEQFKDDMGVDEYQRYSNARNAYKEAENNAKKARRDLNSQLDYLKDDTNNPTITDYGKVADYKAQETYWTGVAAVRGKEYVATKKDLYETPIGKTVEFSDKVATKVKNFISSIFSSSNKNSK